MPEIINNYLSPASFTISIDRMPNVEFFTQSISLPGVSGSPVEFATPLRTMYQPQDQLNYDDITLSFIVDEQMNNYKEILNWMEGLGSPETSKQYADYKKNNAQIGITSDLSVIITNSHKNPNIKFTFKEAFPVSLGGIELNVNTQDIAYATCDVTLRYESFIFETI
jgi:hypothetical protein|tara:strand:+ start:384 stop:884 length:501 start_codon:yes stop_codon:yes gene_type:complete